LEKGIRQKPIYTFKEKFLREKEPIAPLKAFFALFLRAFAKMVPRQARPCRVCILLHRSKQRRAAGEKTL